MVVDQLSLMPCQTPVYILEGKFIAFALNGWIIHLCVFLTVQSWDNSSATKNGDNKACMLKHQLQQFSSSWVSWMVFMSVMRPPLLPLFDVYHLRGVFGPVSKRNSVVISGDPSIHPSSSIHPSVRLPIYLQIYPIYLFILYLSIHSSNFVSIYSICSCMPYAHVFTFCLLHHPRSPASNQSIIQ